MIHVSENWRATYPAAHLGALAMHDVSNPRHHAQLEERKRAVEQALRSRFAGQSKADLAALPAMRAYETYYKRFNKTYHVLLQLRSVALEGKPLPGVAALVEAGFIAELENGLLTAAHDLDRVEPPITLDAAGGDEQYVLLNGQPQTLKARDMIMADAQGVICSVIYGQDRRTAVRPETRRALFIVYAPEGIAAQAIREHLEAIRDNVQLVTPEAVTDHLHVYGGDEPPS